ncbi:MAG TPA: DNA polymerase III subunit gamma/tau, partial [Rhizobiales bacterium]|nr:DNA polymerase III subunit gamma/tau [Hyphomicrobiales bacterium]
IKTDDTAGYSVLARKYRPQTFADLIGQDAMVQTLANAFETGRIAQAYMLTGVRGIGKTTTARLIARALNYRIEGQDDGGPTVDFSQPGIHCDQIMASRHVDVLEMDAASNTGIDDIREIIESVRYRPVSARYKVYIIDEVHMLSRQAFNGLLKTLEEPPDHVKFIFATTEIRKVPITVLSRCQRFDLRRVDADVLMEHFARIARSEGAKADDAALAEIARASEGSVRDGLSLLDQAIAYGSGKVTGEDVRKMLGMVDRTRIIDLFKLVMTGKAGPALIELKTQYEAGADPALVISDLASLVHWVTRLKLIKEASFDATMSQAEISRGTELAENLGMAVLSRAWQMLLKGIAEVNSAPDALAAADMILVRLAYAADLPTPEEIIKKLKDEGTGPKPGMPSQTPAATAPSPAADAPVNQTAPVRHETSKPAPDAGTVAVALQHQGPMESASSSGTSHELQSFRDVVDLAAEKRDIRLKSALERFVRLVKFAPGTIDIQLIEGAPADLANEL